jgi:hypothetical protein
MVKWEIDVERKSWGFSRLSRSNSRCEKVQTLTLGIGDMNFQLKVFVKGWFFFFCQRDHAINIITKCCYHNQKMHSWTSSVILVLRFKSLFISRILPFPSSSYKCLLLSFHDNDDLMCVFGKLNLDLWILKSENSWLESFAMLWS